MISNKISSNLHIFGVKDECLGTTGLEEIFTKMNLTFYPFLFIFSFSQESEALSNSKQALYGVTQ